MKNKTVVHKKRTTQKRSKTIKDIVLAKPDLKVVKNDFDELLLAMSEGKVVK